VAQIDGPRPDPQVCARWGLVPGPVLGDRATTTWAATRAGAAVVLQRLRPAAVPDWRYPLRVAAALRAQGWPTPEPAEEPLELGGDVWLLFHRRPGAALTPAGADRPAEQRARGRLLAELHAAAAATGIADQRGGFAGPAEVVGDAELDGWLRVHEKSRPVEGRVLRACRDRTAAWFAGHPETGVPRSVIHGDFAPWNLLFDGGRLTGVLDFEASHHTVQVADFALSWRGHYDEVLRGYDEVRALSEAEWRTIRPAFWAWMFLGLKSELAEHYGGPGGVGPQPSLRWQLDHLRRRSPLLERRCGPPPALPFDD
jgi:aminoglycoside phosphotransferase (APT) family kinase protein